MGAVRVLSFHKPLTLTQRAPRFGRAGSLSTCAWRAWINFYESLPS
jgi:hypothetical protein